MELEPPHVGAGKGLLAKLGASSAIVIAVASLAITLYEARATREHDRMSVWPRLSQAASDSGGHYDRTITNVGLGPALVKSFAVRLDDTLRTSWTPVVAALLGPAREAPWFFSMVGPGTVILPGQTVHVLTIVTKDQSAAVLAQDARVVGQLCYCSLYDECWTSASTRAEPSATSTCDGGDTTRIGR
jgi:hypothetical protein